MTRAGFVALAGRPNAGKSTLVNRVVGDKVAIVSDKPQTTRNEIRGVRTTPTDQLVFLDTPGVHKPRTLLGERSNQRALATLTEVDVVCVVIEANAAVGPGDRFVAEAARLSQVVRGHHDLGPACVDLANDRFDLACGARVEVRGGLVEEQHLRVERPCPSKREFLLLAA